MDNIIFDPPVEDEQNVIDYLEPKYFIEAFILAVIVYIKSQDFTLSLCAYIGIIVALILLDSIDSNMSDSIRTYAGLYCLSVFFDLVPKSSVWGTLSNKKELIA